MRLSMEQMRAELSADPAGLGYRNADGSWRTASQIGGLLITAMDESGRCRLEHLCDGGRVCLKTIARIVYGPNWLCTMLKDGEIDYREILVLAEQKKISQGVLAAAKAIHDAQVTEWAKQRAASPLDVEFEADPFDPTVDGPVPPNPFSTRNSYDTREGT
jgi:hypothetical protein